MRFLNRFVKQEPYPQEVLNAGSPDYNEDNGTMVENVDTLRKAVVGHRIVKAEKVTGGIKENGYSGDAYSGGFKITLDNGREVTLADSNDCCAYTSLEEFLLDPGSVDHMIMGVGTTGQYSRWHIYADHGDIMQLEVGWSAGNAFFYGYGFYIDVIDERA